MGYLWCYARVGMTSWVPRDVFQVGITSREASPHVTPAQSISKKTYITRCVSLKLSQSSTFYSESQLLSHILVDFGPLQENPSLANQGFWSKISYLICQMFRCLNYILILHLVFWSSITGVWGKIRQSKTLNIGVTFLGKWSFVSHRNLWILRILCFCGFRSFRRFYCFCRFHEIRDFHRNPQFSIEIRQELCRFCNHEVKASHQVRFFKRKTN